MVSEWETCEIKAQPSPSLLSTDNEFFFQRSSTKYDSLSNHKPHTPYDLLVK